MFGSSVHPKVAAIPAKAKLGMGATLHPWSRSSIQVRIRSHKNPISYKIQKTTNFKLQSTNANSAGSPHGPRVAGAEAGGVAALPPASSPYSASSSMHHRLDSDFRAVSHNNGF